MHNPKPRKNNLYPIWVMWVLSHSPYIWEWTVAQSYFLRKFSLPNRRSNTSVRTDKAQKSIQFSIKSTLSCIDTKTLWGRTPNTNSSPMRFLRYWACNRYNNPWWHRLEVGRAYLHQNYSNSTVLVITPRRILKTFKKLSSSTPITSLTHQSWKSSKSSVKR